MFNSLLNQRTGLLLVRMPRIRAAIQYLKRNNIPYNDLTEDIFGIEDVVAALNQQSDRTAVLEQEKSYDSPWAHTEEFTVVHFVFLRKYFQLFQQLPDALFPELVEKSVKEAFDVLVEYFQLLHRLDGLQLEFLDWSGFLYVIGELTSIQDDGFIQNLTDFPYLSRSLEPIFIAGSSQTRSLDIHVSSALFTSIFFR